MTDKTAFSERVRKQWDYRKKLSGQGVRGLMVYLSKESFIQDCADWWCECKLISAGKPSIGANILTGEVNHQVNFSAGQLFTYRTI
jgi:hypothetical protein